MNFLKALFFDFISGTFVISYKTKRAFYPRGIRRPFICIYFRKTIDRFAVLSALCVVVGIVVTLVFGRRSGGGSRSRSGKCGLGSVTTFANTVYVVVSGSFALRLKTFYTGLGNFTADSPIVTEG